MISHEGYGWEIDYWALGAMAYEMIFMDVPFGAKVKGEEAIFRAINTDELTFPPNADELCSKEGQDFIRGVSFIPNNCWLRD
jgi:serine/threonine kinase 32